MKRRSAIAIVAGFVGLLLDLWLRWRRSKSEPESVVVPARERGIYADEPTLIDPVSRVERRLQRIMNERPGVRFDPITLSIIASVICSVLRYCMASSALSLQEKIKRKPDGLQAARLRYRLIRHFQEEKSNGVDLFEDHEQVDRHVKATMQAFVSATPDELRQLVKDIQDPSQDPETLNMRAAQAAYDWSDIE